MRAAGARPADPASVRRETFAVHSYEVDAFGLLAAPALAGYLQESAGQHATELGCGLDALRARGLTWVLMRQRVDIARPVALGDVLEMSTWPSGVSRLFALRDYLVTRGGAEVARASSQWLVVDLARRRPVRPERVLDARYRAEAEQVLPPAAEDLPHLEKAERELRFDIRYQDIDGNLHATNTSYVAWALEAIPQDPWRTCRLASLEIQFLAECTYGSRVVSRIGSTGERAFLHAVAREHDGKELARLRTAWVPREGAPG